MCRRLCDDEDEGEKQTIADEDTKSHKNKKHRKKKYKKTKNKNEENQKSFSHFQKEQCFLLPLFQKHDTIKTKSMKIQLTSFCDIITDVSFQFCCFFFF